MDIIEVTNIYIWPHPCISKILENGDQKIRESFFRGAINNRGIFVSGEGKKLANNFKNFAEENKDYPKVKEVLMKLSEYYEKDYKEDLSDEQRRNFFGSI